MALPLFCVYLGLDIDLRERMPNTNYWYSHVRHRGHVPGVLRRQCRTSPTLFITAASVKDPATGRIAPQGYTSLEIMTLVPADYDVWRVHEGPAAGEKYHRNPDYRSNKDRLTDVLIEGAEQRASRACASTSSGRRRRRRSRRSGTRSRPAARRTASRWRSTSSARTARRRRPRSRGSTWPARARCPGHGIAGVMRGGVGTARARCSAAT